MKRKLLFLAVFFSFFSALSQAPEKMSYQAVIRNAENALLVNQSIGMRVSILQGEINGASVYTETHSINTNANGLATLEIGEGEIVSGTFSEIDWANGPYFILSEIDPEGGNNYTITSSSQLMSVPYALYAKTAGSNLPGPQGPQGPAGPGLSDGTATNQMMYWNGTNWTLLNPGSDGQVLTLCDGQLIWTNGNCPSVVQSLNCSNISVIGVLEQNNFTESVIISLPYTGGNGAHYDAINVNSTGVEGFSARLAEGQLNIGDGVLNFQVIGATEGIGIATFEINVGGQSCSLDIPVNPVLAGPTGIPPIGSYYQGGRLAYIFQPGDPVPNNDPVSVGYGSVGYDPFAVHGIIIAPIDFPQLAPWDCFYYTEEFPFQINFTALGTGGVNTSNAYDLWLWEPLCSDPYTAMWESFNATFNGYNDWVLPSQDELKLILGLDPLFTGLSSYQYYWSSSEASNETAIAASRFPNPSQGTNLVINQTFDKALLFKVRAIRYF